MEFPTTPPISIANPMGLFALAYVASDFSNATNIYTYATNSIASGSDLLGSTGQGIGGAGNAQLAVFVATYGASTGNNSIMCILIIPLRQVEHFL